MLITTIFTATEAILLFLGIFSPFARLQEFWIFEEEFSIYNLILSLLDQQNFLLAVTVLSFGVLIPFVRLCANCIPSSKLKNLNLHKLAMIDIFLISFLIFSSQASFFFEVNLLQGFYFLFGSLVVSFLNHWIAKGRDNVNE